MNIHREVSITGGKTDKNAMLGPSVGTSNQMHNIGIPTPIIS